MNETLLRLASHRVNQQLSSSLRGLAASNGVLGLFAAFIVFLIAGVNECAGTFGLDTGYPGSRPGHAQAMTRQSAIALSNAAISMSWTSAPQGLAFRSIRDSQTSRSLALTGEVFQVVLADGRSYAASTLVAAEKPAVRELNINKSSARMAGRIPGRQWEIPFRSADGVLGVQWRATLLDDANYIRQEISVTPLREDIVIKEIRWLNDVMPAARTAGTVDGSPVVSGDFFFGSEDPHAANGRSAERLEIGKWSPPDLKAGERTVKRWPVSAELLQRGTNEFVFQYEAGPHRLDIWRVALLGDGKEVAVDEHHGRAGRAHSNNIYCLVLPRSHPAQQTRYELAATLSTDPSVNLPEGRRVDSSGTLFLVTYDGRTACRVRRDTPLARGETLVQSFVVGVSPRGQMRRAFLYYLERERAHPFRPFLHYNSWYDTAWHPFALNEENCMEAIEICGERLIKAHGVVMDALVFDDGWDDPNTLWQFHEGFPRGFTPLAELCKTYDTRLGVWLSPFGGYGEPKKQRLKAGREQGFEINAAGFSMAGQKYYAAFKDSCVQMIRRYGVNHFKFDGIATGIYATGGAQYVLDTEAMRRLMLELREEDPNLYINLTTGSWPSPFWLRFADSLWRQGRDMGHAGKGTTQQQWLTYRDQETYRNIVLQGPLYPLNSLMNQGVAYSKHGMAGDPTFTSAGFKDDVRAFFGSGTGLQELYIQPAKLVSEDWRVLAEAANWSRAHADVFVDTHWIGRDPAKLDVYGYASWSPRKGIVMLRNPDDQPREFKLDVAAAFELPPGAAKRYTLKSPWAEDAGKPALRAQAGKPVTLTLQPFEVVILAAIPAP